MKLNRRKNHFAAQQHKKTSQLTTISTKHPCSCTVTKLVLFF